MFRALVLIGLLSLLAGCSEDPAPTAAVEPEEKQSAPALPRTASAEGARLFFVNLEDGATVTSPFTVEFGLENMSVAKAGDDTPKSGHHHLIVDAELPPLDLPVPANENYRHFGDGSNTTELSLPPGEHALQLLLGDYLHIPHDPPVYSERITITVVE